MVSMVENVLKGTANSVMPPPADGPERTGVVLMNLGGPGSLEEIGAFLRCLLSDKKVVSLPWPLRPLLASLIAWRRTPKVAEHYRAIGGKSPIDDQTRAQAKALEESLGNGFVVRHAFSHSPPGAAQVLAELAALNIKRVVGLPAYPQFSLTTSGTALARLRQAAEELDISLAATPSFPAGPGYLEAVIAKARPLLQASSHVIFSAHGLPQRLVSKGDPYLDEVRKSVASLAAMLPYDMPYTMAFQSRLGPIEWLRPYLREELERLGREGCGQVLVIPISFVCENLETLYELDIEMAALAEESGIRSYVRTPTPGCHPAFIGELALLVRQAARSAGWEGPQTREGAANPFES